MASSKAEEFLRAIREVMNKHGATLGEGEDFDGEDRYRGTRKYVLVDGERFEVDELISQKQGRGLTELS